MSYTTTPPGSSDAGGAGTSTGRARKRFEAPAVIEVEADVLFPGSYLPVVKDLGHEVEPYEDRPGWYVISLMTRLDHKGFGALLTSPNTSALSRQDGTNEKEEDDRMDDGGSQEASQGSVVELSDEAIEAFKVENMEKRGLKRPRTEMEKK